MKVLVTSVPASGHVNPLLPLVEAMVAQGDRVVVAAGADAEGAVGRTGAEFRSAGGLEGEWFDIFRSRVRGMPGDGLAPERINHYFVPRLFAEIGANDMIDDVLAAAEDLEPDVVLFETYAFAGPLVAAVVGAPAVHHLISPMLAPEVMELANDAVSPLWRSFGRNVPGNGGVYAGTTIEVSPPSLEQLRVPSPDSLSLRPAPLPSRVPSPTKPPTVYVTMGTFFGGNDHVFRAVLDGVGGEEVSVVVTVGADQDPAVLDPVPADVRVERFIPQSELLPDCSLVVHHGGSGTMFGCLAHGVPQIVIPQGADNFLNADHVVGAGAGLAIQPGELAAESVRAALRRVLDEASFAETARRIAGEIADMPTAGEVAHTLRSRFG